MKKIKLVMVGNGMAGVRTLEELLKLNSDFYDITVFGAEPHPNYNRILLSPVLAGEQTFEEIVLNDLNWYAENGIKLLLDRKVVQIGPGPPQGGRRGRQRGRVRPPAAGHRLGSPSSCRYPAIACRA
ncbi:assimilatory nitrite reductase large subunit [Pseudomonas aeruginosa]|nr:assimilatory nitrite reductase large subunit [Pseudomonas aeruginosa]